MICQIHLLHKTHCSNISIFLFCVTKNYYAFKRFPSILFLATVFKNQSNTSEGDDVLKHRTTIAWVFLIILLGFFTVKEVIDINQQAQEEIRIEEESARKKEAERKRIEQEEKKRKNIMEEKRKKEQQQRKAKKGKVEIKVTGVGDNLVHDIFWNTNPNRDKQGHLTYDKFYKPISKYAKEADLAYINGETVLCEEDEANFSGYPVFHSPIAIADAIDKAGFNWMSVASNHSMDAGVDGMQKQLKYFKKFKNITITGANLIEKERAKPVVKKIKGVRIGLMTYTYGTNGIPVPAGYEHLINLYHNADGSINYDQIEEDINKLKKVSDVQIISMHWGDEYHTEPNAEQQELARFFNSKGIEVVIGEHPHVIQPAEWLEDKESGQKTLVYYSLGNFLSCQNNNENMIGGKCDFTIVYDLDKKQAKIKDAKFSPTVTHYNSRFQDFAGYSFKDYTDQLASEHYCTGKGQKMTKEWIREYFSKIAGQPENIEIELD